jgi:hypothetical protein
MTLLSESWKVEVETFYGKNVAKTEIDPVLKKKSK